MYRFLQSLLMIGTVLGPGTIFLMMIGAMNAITGMSNLNALIINLVPIVIFITVCLTCKSKIQVNIILVCFISLTSLHYLVFIYKYVNSIKYWSKN